jgi:hypothetical protein
MVVDCPLSLQLAVRSGCNGVDDLCARRYNEVSYPTMHNAFATTQDGYYFAQHRSCLRSGLVGGMRAFLLDVHLTTSHTLKLCHGRCWLGSSSLHDTLLTLNEFRRLNPREIVTIFIEVGFDGHGKVDNSTRTIFRSQLKESFQVSGLAPFLFAHSLTTTRWPYLSDMIAQNRQIVVFVDDNTFCSGRIAPWLHCTDQFVAQTPFGITVPSQLKEACVFQHLRRQCDELTQMNLFTNVGSMGLNVGSLRWLAQQYSTTELENYNRRPFLQDMVESCSKCSGMYINFVAVDFWESSDVLQVVATVNANRLTHTRYPRHPDAAFCSNGSLKQGVVRCVLL